MKKISNKIIDQIIIDYNSGKPIIDISKKLNVSKKTIQKYLKLKNILIRKRKYIFNERYFSKIDSNHKAYLLGYIFADGCVRYNTNQRIYYLQLKLHEKDIHILEFLKNELESNSLIIKEKSSNCFLIRFCSKQLVEDLINLGCVPNKSLILEYPKIDKKYYNSFIHGYFDGDGNIYKGKNQIHFKILGTNNFLNSISEYFKEFGINYLVKSYPNSKIFQYRVFSLKSIIKIYDIFYSNIDYIYLNRKKEIFDLILKK